MNSEKILLIENKLKEIKQEKAEMMRIQNFCQIAYLRDMERQLLEQLNLYQNEK